MERQTKKTSGKTSKKTDELAGEKGRQVGLSQKIRHLNCEGEQHLKEIISGEMFIVECGLLNLCILAK